MNFLAYTRGLSLVWLIQVCTKIPGGKLFCLCKFFGKKLCIFDLFTNILGLFQKFTLISNV